MTPVTEIRESGKAEMVGLLSIPEFDVREEDSRGCSAKYRLEFIP